MSTGIVCHVPGMSQYRGQQVDKFGKDTSGQIQYTFNQQGFRHHADYNASPSVAFFGCSLVFGVGVAQHQITASYYPNSHNYGLAGQYDNSDTYQIIKKFTASHLYNNTPMITVWHSRDSENLDQYYDDLKNLPMYHFFCGTPLPYQNCFGMIKNVDQDVSQTHMGPASHQLFYKITCALLNQS